MEFGAVGHTSLLCRDHDPAIIPFRYSTLGVLVPIERIWLIEQHDIQQ
jgi:hypothetical protein